MIFSHQRSTLPVASSTLFHWFSSGQLRFLLHSVLGARNTHTKRLTAPDMGGLIVFSAVSREYARNTRPVREILAGRLRTVFLAPGPFFAHRRAKPRARNIDYSCALEKRYTKRAVCCA